jgi:hypothetical protein
MEGKWVLFWIAATAAVFMGSGTTQSLFFIFLNCLNFELQFTTGILIGYYCINPYSAPREPLDVKLVVDEVTAEKISSNLRLESCHNFTY